MKKTLGKEKEDSTRGNRKGKIRMCLGKSNLMKTKGK